MTQSEHDELKAILTEKPWNARLQALKWLDAQSIAEDPKDPVAGQNEPYKRTWTDNQRKAFHVGCQELADYLNAHGLDMKAVLKDEVNIPWDKDSVKEFIFRPIMKAMWGYESHNQLEKIEQVSQLWNVAMKHLGEKHHVEYQDFPHDAQKAEQNLGGYKTSAGTDNEGVEYPTDYKEPSF